jgi:hypothetical protein
MQGTRKLDNRPSHVPWGVCVLPVSWLIYRETTGDGDVSPMFSRPQPRRKDDGRLDGVASCSLLGATTASFVQVLATSTALEKPQACGSHFRHRKTWFFLVYFLVQYVCFVRGGALGWWYTRRPQLPQPLELNVDFQCPGVLFILLSYEIVTHLVLKISSCYYRML